MQKKDERWVRHCSRNPDTYFQTENVLEEFKNISEIRDLLNNKEAFLKCLDKIRECITKEISENDQRAMLKNYLDSYFWGNVNTFHDWFHDVDSHLKKLGVEVNMNAVS